MKPPSAQSEPYFIARGDHAVHDLHPARRADAAGCTLAAAFRRAELHRKARHAGHVDGIVEHGDPGVADQPPGLREGFVVERQVEHGGREVGPQRPADLHRAHGAAAGGAAAVPGFPGVSAPV